MGMRVVAMRRTGTADPLVDTMFAPARLHELMAVSDVVVVATPLTEETRGLIDAAALAAMKPTAILVNVGRGPVVREQALVEALQRRAIGGAALDVFETEPLPPESPLWGLENVLLSPHSADHTPGWLENAMTCFLRNLERSTAGQPLANVVDPARAIERRPVGALAAPGRDLNIRGVIFDLDGTLVDNMAAPRRGLPALHRAATGCPADGRDRARLDGKRNRDIFPDLFGAPCPRTSCGPHRGREGVALPRAVARPAGGRCPACCACSTRWSARAARRDRDLRARRERHAHPAELGLTERLTRVVARRPGAARQAAPRRLPGRGAS